MSGRRTRAKQVIGTGGTLQVGGLSSWAYLHRLIVGTSAASAVVTVYDGQDATGTVVLTMDATTVTRDGTVEAFFKNGFFITVTGGAAKVTVVYE